MSTHNICLYEEIRKILVIFGLKNMPYLELCILAIPLLFIGVFML